jgi:hypothetical protein
LELISAQLVELSKFLQPVALPTRASLLVKAATPPGELRGVQSCFVQNRRLDSIDDGLVTGSQPLFSQRSRMAAVRDFGRCTQAAKSNLLNAYGFDSRE